MNQNETPECEAWRHPVLEWSYRCKRCGMQVGAPSSDPVGEAFCVDAQTRAMWEAPPTGEPKRASLLPDLTAIWASVFEEGEK